MSENRPLAHCVYFTLADATPATISHLTSECKKYLRGHPGEVYFAAGPLVEDLARPVNDREFHVGLVVVFKDRASHDAYQVAPRHLEFIEKNKPTWAKVRVFDSYYDV